MDGEEERAIGEECYDTEKKSKSSPILDIEINKCNRRPNSSSTRDWAMSGMSQALSKRKVRQVEDIEREFQIVDESLKRQAEWCAKMEMLQVEEEMKTATMELSWCKKS